MRILEKRTCRGASFWGPAPTVRFLVAGGASEELPSRLFAEFRRRLLDSLQAKYNPLIAFNPTGAFLDRLKDRRPVGLLAGLALELQSLAGQRVSYSSVRPAGSKLGARGDYHVIWEYEEREIGEGAGELAVRALDSLLGRSESNFDLELGAFLETASRLSLGPWTRIFVEQARQRDIPWWRLDESDERVRLGRGWRSRRSLLQLGYGRNQRRIWSPFTSLDNLIAYDIAGNKELSKVRLRRLGIPVPKGKVAHDLDESVAAAAEVGYPAVLKPLDGHHGKGAGLNLRDEAALRAHYPLAKLESLKRSGALLVEEYVEGRDYRVVVVSGRVAAVTERVPAHVLGDGSHSVRELVTIANQDPRRTLNQTDLLPLVLDEPAIGLVREQGWDSDVVPTAGQTVWLTLTSNISRGGTPIDRGHEIHPYNADIAVQAALAVGLEIAGVDMIAPDISRSIHETGGTVCEVNSGPGLTEGVPAEVAAAVINALYSPGAAARVPIVSVAGTQAAEVAVRLARVLERSGKRVGLVAGGTVCVAGHLMHQDAGCISLCRMVLENPTVDLAVVQVTQSDLYIDGLDYDRADVAVVTDTAADPRDRPIPLEPAVREEIHRSLLRATSREGMAVISADDEMAVRVATEARGKVVYFSSVTGNVTIERHLREGGSALLVRGGVDHRVMSFADSKRGRIRFQDMLLLPEEERSVWEAQLAVAAALGHFGLTIEEIGEGLQSLRDSKATTCSPAYRTGGS